MLATIKIFGNWRYLLTAIAVGGAVLLLVLWLPNRTLLFSLWTDASVSVGDKVRIPVDLLGSLGTNFSPLSAYYTVAIAALIGINVALTAHLLQARRAVAGGIAAGLPGVFSGAIGVGCAACGSLVLMWFLSAMGGASLLVLLPLRGGEFGIMSVVLLGISTYLLSKQITHPPVCGINSTAQLN